MGLLNKLTEKLHYSKPSIILKNFNSEDIITTSAISTDKHKNEMEMADKTCKKEPTLFEKYPDGLPLSVLEVIDYSKFGAMLKQERLLPPSYDRNPIKVEIDGVLDKPRVILTFKSKTSESKRQVSIYGYSVAYSVKTNQPITILEVNENMSAIWCGFAERVMWNWDRGYNSSLFDPEKKLNSSSYYIDEESLKMVREIEFERQMAIEAAKNAKQFFDKYEIK